jgi:type II secretory pathway predicted ATPase ExeA
MRMNSLYLQTACKHPLGLTLTANIKSQWNSNFKQTDVFTDDALEQLAERLTTPLQIEQHLRLAFEEAYRIDQCFAV